MRRAVTKNYGMIKLLLTLSFRRAQSYVLQQSKKHLGMVHGLRRPNKAFFFIKIQKFWAWVDKLGR